MESLPSPWQSGDPGGKTESPLDTSFPVRESLVGRHGAVGTSLCLWLFFVVAKASILPTGQSRGVSVIQPPGPHGKTEHGL